MQKQHRTDLAVSGRREVAWEMKLKTVTRKGINNTNTIRQWRWRRREVSHSANHCCAHWCRRWTWGRSLTFGPRRRYRGKLLWLVVEGRCCDFEVEGGGHHVRLVPAGLLHVAMSIRGEQKETRVATVRNSRKKIFSVFGTCWKLTVMSWLRSTSGYFLTVQEYAMFFGYKKNCNNMFERNLAVMIELILN